MIWIAIGGDFLCNWLLINGMWSRMC